MELVFNSVQVCCEWKNRGGKKKQNYLKKNGSKGGLSWNNGYVQLFFLPSFFTRWGVKLRMQFTISGALHYLSLPPGWHLAIEVQVGSPLGFHRIHHCHQEIWSKHDAQYINRSSIRSCSFYWKFGGFLFQIGQLLISNRFMTVQIERIWLS